MCCHCSQPRHGHAGVAPAPTRLARLLPPPPPPTHPVKSTDQCVVIAVNPVTVALESPPPIATLSQPAYAGGSADSDATALAYDPARHSRNWLWGRPPDSTGGAHDTTMLLPVTLAKEMGPGREGGVAGRVTVARDSGPYGPRPPTLDPDTRTRYGVAARRLDSVTARAATAVLAGLPETSATCSKGEGGR